MTEFGTSEQMRFKWDFYTWVDFVISKNFGDLELGWVHFHVVRNESVGIETLLEGERWTFKDVHVLIPLICEYITLQDKWEFADMINLKDTEKEIILNYLSGPKVITKVLRWGRQDSGRRERQRCNDRSKIRVGDIMIDTVIEVMWERDH